MNTIEVVLGLLVIATVLAGLARRTRLPEPILLVLAGLVIGLVPGLPHVELEPELVFLFFLPPILYAAVKMLDYVAPHMPVPAPMPEEVRVELGLLQGMNVNVLC